MTPTLRKAVLAGLLLVPLASWQVWALTQDGVDPWTVDGGGGTATGGNYVLQGTAGQPDAGRHESVDGTIVLRGGYWTGAGTVATSIDDDAIPRANRLDAPYPNPFNPQTSVRFALAEDTHVRVEILDVRGRRVRLLVDEGRPAGSHEFVWTGRSDDGAPVASGVYYLRMIADGETRTRKMTLLK